MNFEEFKEKFDDLLKEAYEELTQNPTEEEHVWRVGDEVLELLEWIKIKGSDTGLKKKIKGQMAYELQCAIRCLPKWQKT